MSILSESKNNWMVLWGSSYPHLTAERDHHLRLALNWHKEHTLPVLKRVVNYGIEDKAVPNRGWSPEFEHIHRLQKGMPITQTAEQTQGRENRR